MIAWLFSTIAASACVLAVRVVVGFIEPSHHAIFGGFQMTHLSSQILTCEHLIGNDYLNAKVTSTGTGEILKRSL